MLSTGRNDKFRDEYYRFLSNSIKHRDINKSDMEHLKHGKFNYINHDISTKTMSDLIHEKKLMGGCSSCGQTQYKPQHTKIKGGRKNVEYN